jgi:hypothetical protein
MVLAAIYSVWDGEEHLRKSIEYILNDVDLVIILTQNVSNFGEEYRPNLTGVEKLRSHKVRVFHFNPDGGTDFNAGYRNELVKRQEGVNIAKIAGATHFLLMDADEFYPDFAELKQEYIDSGCGGSVCTIETYVAKETYRITPPMDYRVPFIYKLENNTVLGEGPGVKLDRTRICRCDSLAVLSKPMHHMSWVRNDLDRKLRNSSARLTRNNELIRQEVEYLLTNGPRGFKSKYFRGRFISET